MKRLAVMVIGSLMSCCQSVSSGPREPIPISTLTAEYKQSSAAVRSRYDGKEITVRGYAPAAATMPRASGDQGAIVLQEKDDHAAEPVTCWFSNEQTAEFSRIGGSKYVTVKGIFIGEQGAQLKFCKLIKIE
jgi:hypothetical protein